MELVFLDELSDQIAVFFKRRNKRRNHDRALFDEQLGDFADPADVFFTVRIGKTEIFVQAVSDIITVKHCDLKAFFKQLAGGCVGNRRFP